MKIKHVLMILFTTISIASCNNNINSASENNNISSTLTSEVIESSNTSLKPSSEINDISSTNVSSSNNSSSFNNESSYTSVEQEKNWEDGRKLLDCGYYQMDLPKNYLNPYNLKTTLSQDESSWSNNELIDSLPYGFRYIYRNACDDGPKYHKTSADFYSSNNKAPGGLKIANTGVGFQSLMFAHTGAKLEIRIGISQVNNNSEKPEEGKDTFHIYFFNKNGQYLDKYVVEEKTITTKTTEIKFYWTNNASEVAYFEFRCNAMPYKGTQCYNIGISYCNFKSWERA